LPEAKLDIKHSEESENEKSDLHTLGFGSADASIRKVNVGKIFKGG
jgi:hypothetical protein